MNRKRHTLLEITDQGRKWAFEQVKKSGTSENLVEIETLLIKGYENKKIPGIMRRDDTIGIKGAIPVGFASPSLYDGNRLRVPAYVQEEEITKQITPYEVLDYKIITRNKSLQVLTVIKEIAVSLNIKLGIWGSLGLEIYTSLPYSHDYSDIDLLMEFQDYAKTRVFYSALQELATENDCKIDLEMDLPDGYGIKVAELFTKTEEVLAKGINDVIFISKSTLFK